MKKVVLLLIVGFVAFALYARLRLFVRDPLASVQHNGVAEQGAQVYINYASDVLIENDHSPMYVLLIQHGNHAGLPKELHCLHYIVCLTDADQATLSAAWDLTVEDMTPKAVTYRSKETESIVTLY
ncbi:hypothetical protein SAMN05421819_2115 [Bryocella elongata]|uniref:Uncharacterized protein n=1 Tax=Bryocella elongata TaxID=863522 RepID=A0A1H5Y5J3_9BACT|nr:hypothetical protein [Bryocella elongata]SEG18806.1 hypothetical protein SAMN05421819_2115 [Bryocella elongata]